LRPEAGYTGRFSANLVANSPRRWRDWISLNQVWLARRPENAIESKARFQFFPPIFLAAHGAPRSERIPKDVELMANTAQARKRARQAVKQNAHNSSLRSSLRTAIKSTRKAIVAGDKAHAAEVYRAATSVIDRIADKNIIHKNKAARHKSRLAAALKALNS
jgi:small subunit ribosomal protein S20